MKTHSNEIDGIACAYHCSYQMAVRLLHQESRAYKCIRRLGPMRVHWKPGHGWRLFNQPTNVDMLSFIQECWETDGVDWTEHTNVARALLESGKIK